MTQERYERPYLLYADDDEDDKAILLENMRRIGDGILVNTTENGMDLIRFLDELGYGRRLPSCIILDMNMPVMNGADTLTALKKHPFYRHIPVFLFSTATRPADEDRVSRLGAEAFITKPYGQKELMEICEEFAAYCGRQPLFKSGQSPAASVGLV